MKSIHVSYKLIILFFSILLLSITTNAVARRDIPDDNLAYPVLFISASGGTGSGFYLDYEDSTYFVTARHVLFDRASVEITDLPQNLEIPYELRYRVGYDKTKKILSFDGVMTTDEKDLLIKSAPNSELFKKAMDELYQKSQHLRLQTDKATLFSYSVNLSDTEVNELEIDVTKLFNNGHIKYHHSADVALIKIGINEKSEGRQRIKLVDEVKMKKGPGILTLEKANVKLFNDVLVSNNIFAFGYPTSVSRHPLLNIKLPLIRKGIIAGKNFLLKTIILDAPMYYGNSGGPVLEVEQVSGEIHFRVIGVVTNLIPFQLAGDESFQNSGYSVAVPMDFVFELLSEK